MSKIPATSRWLNACTAMLRRMSSAAMSACRSEKVRTRSGSSASTFSKSAEMHADDAAVLAEEIQRLHGLLGEADDALGREHDADTISFVVPAQAGTHRATP